jgi:hypothetical protein
MHLGRPEHIEIIFGRKVTSVTPGTFSTRLLNRPDQVTVNLSFKHSRIKIYLKQDRALRVETVCNDPADLGCNRGLEHLGELQARARDCNTRLMQAIRTGQGALAALRVQSLSGSHSPPSPRMAGGPRRFGSATLGSRPWPAHWPSWASPSPASRTRACAPG